MSPYYGAGLLSEHESRWRRKILLASLGVLAALMILGITTSSLSLNTASGSESTAQVIWGEPQPIRSDEWLRSTPYWIGQWNDDWSPNLLTPLEYRSAPSLMSAMADWFVYPERELGLLLPTRLGFPFLWWVSTVGAMATTALVLLRFTRSAALSVGFSAITVLSPVVAWWSFSPLEIIWPVTSALLLTDMSRDALSRFGRTGRQPLKSTLLAALAGVAAARLAFTYTPWAIIAILLGFGLAMDFLLRRHGWRKFLFPGLVSIATALILAGFRLLMVRSEYEVLASTVYPGQRRAADTSSELPLMSGPLGGLTQREDVAGSIIGTNLSEISRGWTIFLIPLVVIVVVAGLAKVVKAPWLWVDRDAPIIPYATTTMAVVVASWSLFSWPDALTTYNPLVLVSSDRAAQMLGAMAPILLAVTLPVSMSSVPIHVRRLMGIAVGTASGLLVLDAGARLTAWLPELDVTARAAVAAVTCIVVGGLVFAHRKAPILAVTIVLAFLSVAWVNPLTRGLGDLVLAPVTADVRQVVASGDGRVASDNFFVDAMIAANALPQLSGLQTWGPNRDAWGILDPQSEFVGAWNRGTSYLRFEWANSGDAPEIREQGDQIFVRVDPCDKRLSELGLGFVISMAPRDDACLTERLRFTWSGLDNWIYERS